MPSLSDNLGWGAEPASTSIESGEETIEINGKSFATRWQTKSYNYNETASNKGCSLVVKVWTSDAVPTGIVKKLDDVTCPNPSFGQVPRFMIETYLDSYEGFTPVASKCGVQEPKSSPVVRLRSTGTLWRHTRPC